MVQKTGILPTGRGPGLLSISPKRSNIFEQSQLTAETETGTKYKEPGDNGEMPVKEILDEKCCEMEAQVISNE